MFNENYYKTEIQILFDEFVENSRNLLTDEANGIIEKAKNTSALYTKKLVELEVLEKTLKEREKNIDKTLAEKDKEMRQKVSDGIIKELKFIGSDLTFGQKVFIIRKETIKDNCPKCDGKGHLEMENNGLIWHSKCSDCYYGRIDKEIKYSIVEKIISRFDCRFSVNSEYVSFKSVDDECYIEFSDGTYETLRNIYRTKEEAEKTIENLENDLKEQ